MTISAPARDPRVAYDQLAPFYDAFTAHHDYELWTEALQRLARSHGLSGRRLLDVGCGTGKSFLPFLHQGWQVRACDISAAMVEHARRKAGDSVGVDVADMRELPVYGEFDLVTALDDAVNYLLEADELTAAFAGLARNLAPAGLVLFDVNTLASYRGFFADTVAVEDAETLLLWRGYAPAEPTPGGVVEASFDAFARDGNGGWVRSHGRHVQRHHPDEVIRRALGEAGLECLGTYGQGFDAELVAGVDESRHTKAVYVARRGAPGA
jgi:SAM-dependent methyltransferase